MLKYSLISCEISLFVLPNSSFHFQLSLKITHSGLYVNVSLMYLEEFRMLQVLWQKHIIYLHAGGEKT